VSEHDLVVRGARVVDGTGRPEFTGDICVDGDRITSIGRAAGRGRRELDGDGLVCTPGFVDVHTHYDGQAMWDAELTPSSWHGVTTVVMGNCGVGFAPVRPGAENFLIELMEGVEDIPGTALHEGLDWSWESFPDYLDALDRTPRVMDVAAQVPHAALRAYVLRDRAHDDATPEEVAEMARLTAEALDAGAVGFSTSRTMVHRSKHGPVPGTTAPADELLLIAEAMAAAGHGVFQLISDTIAGPDERAWIVEVARMTGGTVTYSMAQTPNDPNGFRVLLADAEALAADGLDVVPQVPSRPTGMLFGLESSLHPFITHPTYRALADLPLAERVGRLRQPEVRAALLAEEPSTGNPLARFLISRYDQIFPLGDPPDYEPPPAASVAAEASRSGRSADEVALDWLLADDGRALLFAPLASYVDGDHEAIREMMVHPRSILGLGDGGAHCGLICDASMTTTMLTHWVRDRTRGDRIPLEQAVHLLARPAAAYGFTDRGTIEPGKRADLNLIDIDSLRLRPPTMTFDLPAGGRRLVQRADGYIATVAGGEVTFEGGEATGSRPGRLVRFGA
jgi:N-acyl-D-amino-acid deacylase